MIPILLTDPRLPALAAETLDSSAVTATPAPIAVAAPTNISLRRDGSVALFKVGETETAVHIDGDTVTFFPKRSSAHRQLLAKLGIDE